MDPPVKPGDDGREWMGDSRGSATTDPQLTPRYWATFGLITLQLICEIFDFFIVGFIIVVIFFFVVIVIDDVG